MGISNKTHYLDFDKDDVGGYRLRLKKMQMSKRPRYVWRTAPIQVNKCTWLMEKSKM